MRLKNGSVIVGHWRTAPILLHWSILLTLLFFSRFSFQPVFLVALVSLIVLHELGHAWMVRWFRFRVVAIEVNGFGGTCRWRGRARPIQRAWIAWGGVLAQAIVLIAALAWFSLFPPTTNTAFQAHDALTRVNLWIIGLNLLPIPPLDGATAWKLPGLLWTAMKKGRKPQTRPKKTEPTTPEPAAPIESREEELRRIDALVDQKRDPTLAAEIDAMVAEILQGKK
jgi:Zn-dependent protease